MSASSPFSGQQQDTEAISSLIEHSTAWATANGMSIVVKDPAAEGRFTTSHLPFSLMPNTLPRPVFDHARALAPLFNDLVDRISRDTTWLRTVLKETAESDPFTGRLLGILDTVEAEGGPKQDCSLGIHRSDYMLHDPDDGKDPYFLQVELNTIASSFGCVSHLAGRLHQHLLWRFAGQKDAVGRAVDAHLAANGVPTEDPASLSQMIPPNPTITELPAAIACAHKHYGRPDALAVFVVQPGESNAVDQRLLEFALWDNHKVKVRRMSLAQISQEGRLSEGRLLVGGGGGGALEEAEVAVVYFRAGYTPDDYHTEADWEARLLIERSLAVKCPNIAYHLAGTKKVQQVLANPGEVERFMGEGDASRLLRSCFAGLYSLGGGQGEQGHQEALAAREDALVHPEQYVLKPQREGGGNNYYGEDVAKKLRSEGSDLLKAYILMQRIFPRFQKSLMVNRGRITSGNSVSEYGIYGVYVGRGGDHSPLLNEYAGYLVRTKLEGVNEGGVASGYAVLSSPILTSLSKNA